MKRTVQRGLTIIELMIVVAIIGILASVAIPAWQDYTVREKVREAVNLANPARTALGIVCSQGDLSGADNQSLGLSPGRAYSGDYTRNVAAAGLSSTEAIVTVTLRPIGAVIDDGQQIVYTGACGADGMRWTVGGDLLPKYLPRT
jgi:type IV pilus assembly protein PilA